MENRMDVVIVIDHYLSEHGRNDGQPWTSGITELHSNVPGVRTAFIPLRGVVVVPLKRAFSQR